MKEIVLVFCVWVIACWLVSAQKTIISFVVQSDQQRDIEEAEAAAAWHKEKYGW